MNSKQCKAILDHRVQIGLNGFQNGLRDRAASSLREAFDLILESSRHSNVYKLIGILWDVIKEVGWSM